MIAECLVFGVPVGVLYAYLGHTKHAVHKQTCQKRWFRCRYSHFFVLGVVMLFYLVNVVMNGGF